MTKTQAISRAGFIAGTLDILTAFLVYSVIMQVADAGQILRSIASGLFGKQAYDCSPIMPFIGLLLHYCIAFIFTIFYFVIYAKLAILHKNKIALGLGYGVFVWVVMNLGVLEIIFPKHQIPALDDALVGMAILMVMVVCRSLGWRISSILAKSPLDKPR